MKLLRTKLLRPNLKKSEFGPQTVQDPGRTTKAGLGQAQSDAIYSGCSPDAEEKSVLDRL